MRISDWSSDVCSSDLVHQGAIEDSGTTIAEHRVDPLGQIALRRRADDQRTTETKPRKLIAERSQATRREYHSSWIGLVSETTLHLHLLRPRLSGRASCRASVCNYVLIEVVGVTLK